jgi:hypothetical protein
MESAWPIMALAPDKQASTHFMHLTHFVLSRFIAGLFWGPMVITDAPVGQTAAHLPQWVHRST